MSYLLEKKDETLDYPKRQILLVQESYKVGLPFFAALCVALVALNIANAVTDFMRLYICVLIDIVGIGALVHVFLRLLRGNARQRNLFSQLREREEQYGRAAYEATYVKDTLGALSDAGRVRIYETEDAYTVLPVLPAYRHVPFTRYDFRGDFGRLTLAKAEWQLLCEQNELRILSGEDAFAFDNATPVAQEKTQGGQEDVKQEENIQAQQMREEVER